MALPKIIWAGNTLVFAYEPQKVMPDDVRAEREDSISTGGVKQSIVVRVDEFLELQVILVPDGTDPAAGEISAWKNFMRSHALLGFAFNYYPDKDQAAFQTYTLENTSWRPELQFRGNPRHYKFELKLRRQVL